jgi:WD40 repeat protein
LPKGVINSSSCRSLTEIRLFGEGEIKGMAFSKDGKLLLVWADGSVSGYDLEKGERKWFRSDLSLEEASLVTGILKTDVILAADKNNVLVLLDLASGKTLNSTSPADIMKTLISPDGKYLGVLDWIGGIAIYDAKTMKSLHQISPDGETFGDTFYLSSTFSPDSKYLLVGASGGEVRLYDVKTGKLARKVERIWKNEDYDTRAVPRKLVVSGNGTTLAIEYGQNSVVYVMTTSLGNPKPGQFIPGENPALSPDGKTLAFVTPEGLQVVTASDKKPLATLPIEPYGAFRFSPDGKTLAAATLRGLELVDTATWQTRAILEGFYSRYDRASLSPDGKILAALEKGQWLSLITVSSGKTVKTELPHPATTLAFSPDSSQLLLNDTENLTVWDPQTAKALRTHTLDQPAELLTLASNGEQFASLDKTGKLEIQTFDGKTTPLEQPVEKIAALAFAPDSQRLFAALEGGKMIYWSASDGFKSSQPLEPAKTSLPLKPQTITFSLDGQKLILSGLSGETPKMFWWDLQTGQPLPPLTGAGNVYGAESNPAAQFALGPLGNVLFINSESFSEPPQLHHTDGNSYCRLELKELKYLNIRQALFSPNGRFLFILGSDGLVHVFEDSE